MEVLLWGAYQQGNFGDDLMAVIFAKRLEEHGHQVEVFGLQPSEAKRHELSVCKDIDAGVRWSDAVVIGGGAVLKEAQVLRTILKSAARKIEMRYVALRRAVLSHSKPVYFCSIGSDGIMSFGDVSWARRLLFSSGAVVGGTVRLEKDVALLAGQSIEALYVPDVLLGAARHLNQLPTEWQFDRPRILLNLHRRYASFGRNFVAYAKQVVPHAEIFITPSHLPEADLSYEWHGDGVDAKILKYEHCFGLLDTLQTMSLILSSKLHIGLTAMSYGVPFFSVGGRGKVRDQLAQLGLEDLCILHPDVPVRLEKEVLETRVRKVREKLAATVTPIALATDGHFDWLKRALGT